MKLRECISIMWLSAQIFMKELQVNWLIWKQRRGEKRSQRCLRELQSAQIDDDDISEWIGLIRTMNPDIPPNIFLGEKEQ